MSTEEKPSRDVPEEVEREIRSLARSGAKRSNCSLGLKAFLVAEFNEWADAQPNKRGCQTKFLEEFSRKRGFPEGELLMTKSTFHRLVKGGTSSKVLELAGTNPARKRMRMSVLHKVDDEMMEYYHTCRKKKIKVNYDMLKQKGVASAERLVEEGVIAKESVPKSDGAWRSHIQRMLHRNGVDLRRMREGRFDDAENTIAFNRLSHEDIVKETKREPSQGDRASPAEGEAMPTLPLESSGQKGEVGSEQPKDAKDKGLAIDPKSQEQEAAQKAREQESHEGAVDSSPADEPPTPAGPIPMARLSNVKTPLREYDEARKAIAVLKEYFLDHSASEDIMSRVYKLANDAFEVKDKSR